MKQTPIRIKVDLTNNPYEVVIGKNLLKQIGNELLALGFKQSTKILIVSNPVVAKEYANQLIQNLHLAGFTAKLLVLEAGESQKNIKSIGYIHDSSYEQKLERNSLMIALGGGVVGDMTGFAAATWLRGIPFVQIPTTLLAMVDASVGGKTGVNHPKGKNLIGAFHQPKLVLIDPVTLKTLPDREFRAGIAEVIKYGVIGDKKLFELLENAKDIKNLNSIDKELIIEILYRSVKSKAKIVEQDERESGLRAILNYGHTFGHVIETLEGYGVWIHGEAVSIGMIVAGELAIKKNLWTIEDNQRQKELLLKAGLPIHWPKLNITKVLETLTTDKKVKDGNIKFILPKSIGKVIIDDIDNEEIKKFIYNLNQDSNC